MSDDARDDVALRTRHLQMGSYTDDRLRLLGDSRTSDASICLIGAICIRLTRLTTQL